MAEKEPNLLEAVCGGVVGSIGLTLGALVGGVQAVGEGLFGDGWGKAGAVLEKAAETGAEQGWEIGKTIGPTVVAGVIATVVGGSITGGNGSKT